MAAVISGDGDAEGDSVPPTFAAVYCLAPTLAKLFSDSEVGINLAGLIHGEQRFEWPEPVHPGDIVDSEAEIESIEDRRGMTFLRVRVQATRPSDGATVCKGNAVLIVRGGAS
jgi:acyl dehydratase